MMLHAIGYALKWTIRPDMSICVICAGVVGSVSIDGCLV